jgi:hypothetical protein
MFETRETLLNAQSLIEQYRYVEARALLRSLNHPTAEKWLERIKDYRDGLPPEQQNIKRKNDDYYVIGDDDDQPQYEYVLVKQQDYTTMAVITLVLYWVGYLPGLLVNIWLWYQANQEEKATGIAPAGKGCLSSLLAVFAILPFLFFCMICTWSTAIF